MKKFIQNLLMPFAVVAMLSVGAFTVNASNRTDVTVVNDDPELQTPYEGDLYYWDKNSLTFESAEREAPDNTCTLFNSGVLYIESVDGIGDTPMFGIDPLTNQPGAQLYEITQH